jgi:formylglycine-generating enzyme required for sulfatase activity
MKRVHFLFSVFMASACVASAAIPIDTVFVGDAGNANDTTGYGGVGYNYYIGTYEVTNSQYTAFLNATAASDSNGLWNSNMGSDPRGGISRSGTSGSYTYSTRANMGNKPVNYVSFWDAARFTNWLTTGDTESGVYELTPTAISNNTVTRNTAVWNAGGVAVASEDEWYKAAYYDPTLNGGTGGYWLYPTQSDSSPTQAAVDSVGDVTNPGTNVVNYFPEKWPGGATTVGGTTSESFYGTFDQGGNAREWLDDITLITDRVIRGGSFVSIDIDLRSSNSGAIIASAESSTTGFRVTSLAPIPEPTTFFLLLGSFAVLWAQRRRLNK